MPTALLQAMRPHQWVKNLLVFAPLVFTHEAGVRDAPMLALLAFGAFCVASSSVYMLNDVVDRPADRLHPKKQHRPIASGRVPVAVAAAAIVGLVAGAAGLAWYLAAAPAAPVTGDGPRGDATRLGGIHFWVWLAAYLALNLAYSFRLKQIVIVDALCIALGFQFRVLAGAAAIATRPSSWILLCTFFFALFLAFCKRREEVVKHGDSGSTRQSLRDYDAHFLDQMINPLAAMSILAYALYTVDEKTVSYHGTTGLALTVPFVVFGVFRYLYLVHRRGQGDDPSRLLFSDRQLLVSGVLWAGCVMAVVGPFSLGR